MGLKLPDPPTFRRGGQFQTDPCGVEAVEEDLTLGEGGFRRTLVGLKHTPALRSRYGQSVFQTDPCGVEARLPVEFEMNEIGFRRTLVGLKHLSRGYGPADRPVSDGPLWG